MDRYTNNCCNNYCGYNFALCLIISITLVRNLINDEQLLKDNANGANVIYHNEVKSGEDTIIDSGNRRIIRSDQS
jgi:hypothetical protein